MIQWPERPRPVADVESELARLSRGLEARLDEAIPDRLRAREAVAVAKWRDASVRDAQELIAMGEAEIKQWDHQHRWQSLLDRVGIRQDSERRMLLASLAERRAALEEAQTQAARAKSEARSLVSVVQERDRVERPAIEAAAAVEAAELPRLHGELEKAKAFEAAQETRQQEREQIRQATQAEAVPVPKPALDLERVAAFKRRKVDRPGPENAFQREFDVAAARAGLIIWESIAIRGTAAALTAGNSVADTRRALAACWPGDPSKVDELIQEGRAQQIVERVREAIEAAVEPSTRAGEELMSLVRDHGHGEDDQTARMAVLIAFDASREALAMDPALRGDQESDRPAPRLQ